MAEAAPTIFARECIYFPPCDSGNFLDHQLSDSITALPAGSAATASVSIVGTVLHFSFGIPQGANGSDGTNGTDGAPGEVTTAAMNAAIAAAQRIGSRWVGLFSGALPGVPLALQQAAFIDNLRFAADRARKADVVLLLENMSHKSIAGMLLHHIGDAYLIARAVDHAHVKLMFDTSHIQIMDGDLLANMEAVWSEVALVQIADNPGRLEPGSGEINFASVFRALKAALDPSATLNPMVLIPPA